MAVPSIRCRVCNLDVCVDAATTRFLLLGRLEGAPGAKEGLGHCPFDSLYGFFLLILASKHDEPCRVTTSDSSARPSPAIHFTPHRNSARGLSMFGLPSGCLDFCRSHGGSSASTGCFVYLIVAAPGRVVERGRHSTTYEGTQDGNSKTGHLDMKRTSRCRNNCTIRSQV